MQRAEHEVAITVLRDGEGYFFMHKRRPDKRVFPSLWGCGAGGKLDEGEPHDVAARRELQEETGIDRQPSFRFSLEHEDNEVASRMHIYELVVDRSDVGFDQTEWCDTKWVDSDELRHLAVDASELCPDTATFLRKYLDVKVSE